jgi:glycosyltransferase involved in cell wall biosynthesis
MSYSICHITTVHSADDVRIFYKQCLALAEKEDYKVIICAPGNIPSDTAVVHHKIPFARSFRPFRLINSQLISLKLIFTIKANVWHIHDPELLPAACLLILMKRRVIWDSHEDYKLQFELKNHYRNYIPKKIRPTMNLLIQNLLRYVDENAAGVIGATTTISKKYTNLNTITVGNEAVLEEFDNCKPEFTNSNVLFTGSPDSEQCYLEVVDAIAQIQGLNLVVACKEMPDSYFRYSVKSLNERFKYLGWLNRRELSEAMSKSIVGLVTYSNSVHHELNQPNKFYEFCAAGLPILATPTTSNNKLIKSSNAGILSKGFDQNSILESLNLLILSEKRWVECSVSGKVWAKSNGNWEPSRAALLEFYSKVVKPD